MKTVADNLPADVSMYVGPRAPRIPFIPEYEVHFGNGQHYRSQSFDACASVYLLSGGYGLVNLDKQTDDDNFAGLTDEQRGVIGL